MIRIFFYLFRAAFGCGGGISRTFRILRNGGRGELSAGKSLYGARKKEFPRGGVQRFY